MTDKLTDKLSSEQSEWLIEIFDVIGFADYEEKRLLIDTINADSIRLFY